MRRVCARAMRLATLRRAVRSVSRRNTSRRRRYTAAASASASAPAPALPSSIRGNARMKAVRMAHSRRETAGFGAWMCPPKVSSSPERHLLDCCQRYHPAASLIASPNPIGMTSTRYWRCRVLHTVPLRLKAQSELQPPSRRSQLGPVGRKPLTKAEQKEALVQVEAQHLERVAFHEALRADLIKWVIVPMLVLLSAIYLWQQWILSRVKVSKEDAEWFMAEFDSIFGMTKGTPLAHLKKLHWSFALRATGPDGTVPPEEFYAFAKNKLQLEVSEFPQMWMRVLEASSEGFNFPGFLRAYILMQRIRESKDIAVAKGALITLGYVAMDSSMEGKVRFDDILKWVPFGLRYQFFDPSISQGVDHENLTIVMASRHPGFHSRSAKFGDLRELIMTPEDFIHVFEKTIAPVCPILGKHELEVRMYMARQDWMVHPIVNPEMPSNAIIKEEMEQRFASILKEKALEKEEILAWERKKRQQGSSLGLQWITEWLQRQREANNAGGSDGRLEPDARDDEV